MKNPFKNNPLSLDELVKWKNDKMSNLIPIKICELAIENLNKRIAELETENNRLRAETTRTIIPESAYNELKIDASNGSVLADFKIGGETLNTSSIVTGT